MTCEIGRVTPERPEILELRLWHRLARRSSPGGSSGSDGRWRVLAHGELVDVEGEIGVRITGSSASPPS